jgi:hypothetical protein
MSYKILNIMLAIQSAHIPGLFPAK